MRDATPNGLPIEEAAIALARGELVGMPTETVYGLAADAANPDAVARVFAAKGRPQFNPLISHVADLEMAMREGVLDGRALALAGAFWPGPLTLVVPVAETGQTSELARAGLSTIGLRVPRHPIAQALLRAHAGPVSAPSANPSGKLSPTAADDVRAGLGDSVSVVLDGGASETGIESTIVGVIPGEPVRLLRPGAIAREDIEALVGPLTLPRPDKITAPGQLTSHYAPRAAVRLNASEAQEGEVLLAFGPGAPPAAANLSEDGDTVEAAANLYRQLRELDATGARCIAVMPIPETKLGEAINDRLIRAAASRVSTHDVIS
ncbi:MAG: L-threonylcarbamoyladenylate synthase [Pseudomonadota bacterium]